jgi:hypothetical protein
MKNRLSRPGQCPIAPLAALVMVGLASVPVLAAPGPALRCESSKPVVSPPTTSELAASPAAADDETLKNHLLNTDARSAARGAFADEASTEVSDEAALEADEEDSPADPGLRSASEGEALPFKRQMYRRDI